MKRFLRSERDDYTQSLNKARAEYQAEKQAFIEKEIAAAGDPEPPNTGGYPAWRFEEALAFFKRQAEALDPSYPDDNPKTIYGDKKSPVHLVPPSAIAEEAEAFRLGAKKYGPYNWREKTVSSNIYYAAALRHLMAWWDGEDVDPESGALHLAHARACMAILLDAKSIGRLNDNRPISGNFAEVVAEREKKDEHDNPY